MTLDELLRKVDAGDRGAERSLSEHLSAYASDAKELQQVMDWALKAAARGNACAQYMASKLYGYGKLFKTPLENGHYIIPLLKASAEQGYAPALYTLGSSYRSGMFVPKDGKLGFKLCLQAAELGYAEAEYEVGLVYIRSEYKDPQSMEETGVEKDMRKGIKWLQRAASGSNYSYADMAYEQLQRLEKEHNSKSLFGRLFS